MSIGIAEALVSLRPGAAWKCMDNYNSIVWLDEVQTIPTEQEVADEIIRLQQEYDYNLYQRQRAKEYPTIEQQMDMQYWDLVNGTTTWKDAIESVKNKYPKPE